MSETINSLSNISALKARANAKASKYENIPKEYMDVAEGMETQFVNHMLKEMRNTINTAEKDSNANNYYKSLMDYERSKIMTKTENGIGLKDMILDQIYPKHMRVGMSAKHAMNTYRQQEVDSNQGDGNE